MISGRSVPVRPALRRTRLINKWEQVDLDAALIRLESDQTKTAEARTIPSPDELVRILKLQEREGLVFDGTNLRKAWQRACAAAGLGTQPK